MDKRAVHVAPEVIWPILALLIDQPEATSNHLLHQSHPCPAQVVLIHHLYPHQLLKGELHVLMYLQWNITQRCDKHKASKCCGFGQDRNKLKNGVCLSHLGIKVRWQCFSSSESLYKKGFPVCIFMLYACGWDEVRPPINTNQSRNKRIRLWGKNVTPTFWRYEGFSTWRTPSYWVHLGDAEITPEVLTGVIVKTLIPQESLEPCRALQETGEFRFLKLETFHCLC